MLDFIIIFAAVAAVTAAIAVRVKNKGGCAGCSSCKGGCENCPGLKGEKDE